MKRWQVALVVVVVLAAAAWLAFGSPEDEGAGSGIAARDADDSTPPLLRGPEDADPKGHAVEGEVTPAEPTTDGTRDAGIAPEDEGFLDAWRSAEPAVRPHPIRPPGGRGPRLGGGERSGGTGPTGHWSRFPPPPPPRGTASLHVEVVDSDGTPVAQADVYLGPPSTLGSEAVSFGDLRKVGRTEANGRLAIEALPAGAAALAANAENRLNGPRGLDMQSSVPVLLEARRVAKARVTLPFSLSDSGSVEGTVLGPEETPLARAEIRAGFFRTYADEAGRFEIPRIGAGPQQIAVLKSGYRAERVDVEIHAGRTERVTIRMEYAESGSLRLEGRVEGPEGERVAGANVYLMLESSRRTLRSTRTDEEGLYVFESLPDRVGQEACRVQAGAHRRGYPARVVHLESGIGDGRLDIRLPERQVLLRLRLRDASTNEPVTRCRVEPQRIDDAEATPRPFLGSSATGEYEKWLSVGTYALAVEAPDHETQHVEVDVKPGPDPIEIVVRMSARGAASTRVTLVVIVLDEVSNAPIASCRIGVLNEDGAEVARFDGSDAEGRYSLPAPSGRHVLRVAADGYEEAGQTIDLAADAPEAEETIYLRPD